MSKRHYKVRVAPETTLGERPAGSFYEVDLPGLDFSVQRPMSASNRVRPNLVPLPGKKGPKGLTAQATTDFGYRYGGEPYLFESAFGTAELPAITLDADELQAADNALVRNAGWGSTGLTAGQVVWVEAATAVANPPTGFLAPIVEVSGNLAKVDQRYITLVDEVVPLTVRHTGNLKLGGQTKTLTLESWNGETARGDEYNGVSVNSWGFNLQFGQQGAQVVQQSWGVQALTHQVLTQQIPQPTVAAVEARAFDSGASFQDLVNPLGGLGFRYGGMVLDEVLFDSVQLQYQTPVRSRGGAGHDGWKRTIRDQDATVTLTVTFGRRETTGDSHQDLLIDGALGNDSSDIGFGFRDLLARRAYLYLPVLEAENVRLPGPGRGGDDSVQITYKGYAEASELWSPLFLAWL